MKESKSLSIIVSLLAYVFAICLAFLTFQHFTEMHWLLRLAIADIAATLFIFVGAVLLNNSSLYDPYWSVKPMVIAFAYMLFIGFDQAGWFEWLAFVLVQLYGLRLTTNFYRDWPGFVHEDWRYVNFRNQFGKAYWLVSLSGIHIFPTLMVYLACLPMYAIFFVQIQENTFIAPLAVVGAIVLLGSIVLAYVADEQMRTFRNNPNTKGKYMNEKLWRKSRHPNYLGEILTWWGLYLMALSVNISFWWTGIGALAITLMFVFASIPMLDKRSTERRPGFEEHIKKTNMLLPF